MRLQKQLSKKTKDKVYSKYVVVIPEKSVNESGLKAGDELDISSGQGSIILRKKRD